jgi:hypothetical protein
LTEPLERRRADAVGADTAEALAKDETVRRAYLEAD